MKKRIISITVLFSLVVILISGIFYLSVQDSGFDYEKSGYIVDLNEIASLNQKGEYEAANQKIKALQENMRSHEAESNGVYAIPVLCGTSVLFFFIAFGYIYFAILRPFEKMKGFAAEIAKGNLNIPLKYQRSNYFGQFTWAFDSMRNEITKARANEREAVENNKTIIATLSHDIKSPIASIRAYTEGLSANMDSSYEKREKYLSVIMRKCDEVARLTDDLFLHSVSDLDRLKIIPERVEIAAFTENVIKDISAERGDVIFKKPDFTAYVRVDKKRLVQLCENIINNARKYAKTDIEVFFTKEEKGVILHFRDFGKGIPDENMPFIFDKFYRGSNCGNEQGSGLGLYIVKYIAEKMGGQIILQNHTTGLEVKIILPEDF